MKEFWFFFVTQCLQYFLITAQTRAIAQASYFWTGLSDLIFASVNFALIKKISQSETKYAIWGYTLGGTTGSLIAIWVSKAILGA